MSELEEIRIALNLSQAEMGKLMGAAQSSYNRWESSPGAKSSRDALERAKEIYRERKGKEWEPPGLSHFKFPSRTPMPIEVAPQVTSMLPEHVQTAYEIITEVIETARLDITTMDRARVGLVIGLAAEEVARGNPAEIRPTLRRRAEVLLGLANRSSN